MTKLKAKLNHIRRFEHQNLTLAFVGIFINLRRQAIEVSFGKEISSTVQGRAWFRSSNHITLVNYLGSMGPYEDICSQEQERMRGIKSMQVYS